MLRCLWWTCEKPGQPRALPICMLSAPFVITMDDLVLGARGWFGRASASSSGSQKRAAGSCHSFELEMPELLRYFPNNWKLTSPFLRMLGRRLSNHWLWKVNWKSCGVYPLSAMSSQSAWRVPQECRRRHRVSKFGSPKILMFHFDMTGEGFKALWMAASCSHCIQIEVSIWGCHSKSLCITLAHRAWIWRLFQLRARAQSVHFAVRTCVCIVKMDGPDLERTHRRFSGIRMQMIDPFLHKKSTRPWNWRRPPRKQGIT